MIQPNTTERMSRTFPNVVIRASAGTGKTFQLSNRFIGLILAGAQPEQALAVTFARKAAGEILDRVLLRLAEAASDPVKALRMAEQLDDTCFDAPCAMAQLKRLAQQLHRLRIGTLDGFFVQLASNFSLELGMPPGWRIADELDDRRLRSEAIRAVLARKSTVDVVALLQLLSKGEVRRSVTSQIWDSVGGLYTLYCETSRDAWHDLERPTPLEPEELAAAHQALMGVAVPDGTRWQGARDADAERVSRNDWPAFLATGLAAKILSEENTYYKKPIPPDVIAVYRPLIEHARAILVRQLADQTEGTWKLLDDFDAEYQRLKLAAGSWRFEDVTRRLANALRDKQIPSPVYRLDAPITHLLLDEFQDTSLAQWEVVRRFAEDVANGDGGSFLCVGDVKQAIYGWRGGLSEIFDSIVDQLSGLSQESLKTSYRSSQIVIDTVNRVFEKIHDNRALNEGGHTEVCKAWKAGYETHTTAKVELRGHCRLVAAPRGEDQRLATLRFAAQEIRRLAKLHPSRTVGVLVRKNETVARLIYLLRNDANEPIAASEEGGNPLTDSLAVQLMLSLLKVVDHPGDKASRFHVATSHLGPMVGLTHFKDDDEARQVAARIRHDLATKGYGRTTYRWVEQLAAHCDRRELSRLSQFVEMAYTFDADATTRATDFVAHVTETRVEDPSSAQVRVMTVHQAKGLQFDIVVLPEMDVPLKPQTPQVVIDRDKPGGAITRICKYVGSDVQALLPPRYRRMFERWPQQSVNEALCLLYVAMTRAVHALHMIIPPPRENERTFPKTYAGTLRSALVEEETTIAPEAVLFEHGNDDWDTSLKDTSLKKAASPQATEAVLADVRLKPTTSRRRGFDRAAPSSLEGGPLVDLKRRMRLDTSDAMLRGSLFHAWLATIEWLDPDLVNLGAPSDTQLLAAAQGLELPSGDVTRAIAEFRRLLDRKPIRDVLSRGPTKDGMRYEVQRERPFIVREGDTIMRGAIDRLVLTWRKTELVSAEVIDFKSDQVKNEKAIDAAIETYRPQIEAYRNATAQITGLDVSRIGATLVFLEPAAVRKLTIGAEAHGWPSVGLASRQ